MKKTIFKWVQISDIHFQPYGEGFNTNRLREKLEETLNGIKKVNALILTGDYRFAPSKETNPKPVADYIRVLADSLGLKSSMENVILVQGNHDLSRDGVRRAVVLEERNNYSPEQGIFETTRLKYLQSGFAFYKELAEELKCTYNLGTDGNPHTIVDFNDYKLLLLNTAITASGEDDEHNLILGSKYLNGIFHNSEPKPTIALGHHGLELLNEKERRTCTKYLEDIGIYLYLCGHSHVLWLSEHGGIKQINVGCLRQSDSSVDAGFSVGELFDDGTVSTTSYKWSIDFQSWNKDEASSKEFYKLYEKKIIRGEDASFQKAVIKTHPFALKGLTLLGSLGTEGVKYHWERNGHSVESLAFNRRLKSNLNSEDVDKTSAYTISVSYGCQLSTYERACKFCETAMQKYYGNLTAEDIALQSIFMAEYDSNCPSFPQVQKNHREFAFMGQGEPGLNYPAVRQAILLTDKAMEIINQNVSRYIISTCGIIDFLPLLIDDIKQKHFHNRVTLHFSLHVVGEDRNILMPINHDHNYLDFIKECARLREISGEKVGVGILMFKEYRYQRNAKSYTLNSEKLKEILKQLDKDIFKIDLCTLNTPSFGSQKPMSYESAQKLLDVVKQQGFEGKIFSSFGENVNSGCGMLSSDQTSMQEIGNTTIEHYNASIELLNKSKADIGYY